MKLTFQGPALLYISSLRLSKVMIPKWLGSFFFALSHVQILALIIKSVYIALPDDTPNVSPVIKLFVKLFIIGDWWRYGDTARLLAGTLIITFYMMKMASLIIYIHFCLCKKYKIPDMIQSYCSLVHRLHPLLIFFWIHTFCLEIIKHSYDYDDFNKPVEVSMTVMAYLNIIINCILAVFLSAISLIYKTKDVMSSKTNLLETKTVIFKIIIPILWRVAENNRGIQIFILVLCLLNAISHDSIFIKYLPYYRVKILVMSAVFQAMETSVALISCIIKIIEESGTKTKFGVFSVQIIWLLALPIFVKLYCAETWRLLLYIFGCKIKDEKNVYYLVHKRFILLYFLKSRKAIHEGILRLSYADIMYQGRLAEVGVESQLSFEELDMNKKVLVRNLKMICLKALSQYPRALLAQINLANSYSNFEDLYLVSNNLLEDAISKRPGYHAQISLHRIRFELQKRLRAEFSQKIGEGLNISSYITNQELLEEMKKSIEKQAEMQLSFWKEFMSSQPKMLNLMKIAFKVQEQRIIIKKIWNSLVKIRPVSFISPLTVYGMYSSFINNNPIEGEKYLEQSREDMKKMDKAFKADELNHETIFSNQAIRTTISGVRAQLGKIIDCSRNIADFYGWQSSDMKDRPVTSLMPPFFRSRHDSFLLNHFNTGKTKLMNTNIMIPVKRSNGYIHPSWIHVKVSPLMDSGMSYVALIRPLRSNQRMILVRKDGKIDDMSFEFAKDMNLIVENREVDLFTLCPELKQINEAFNVIAKNSIPVNEDENNNEALCDQNDLVINTFQSSGNKKGLQRKTINNLLASERSLLQRGSTAKSKRNIIQLETGPEKDCIAGVDEDETSSDEDGAQRFNYMRAVTRMDKNKAQYIYDEFNAGSTLVFHPQNAESIKYSAKIMNSIHGKDVIKFVLLEKVSGENDGNEGVLSGKEALFSSLKIMADRFTNRNDLGTETLSSPKKIYIQTSPTGIETERGELINLATSPRLKTKFKFSEEDGNSEADLSVIDEVQDLDSAAKNTVNRNFLRESSNFLSPQNKTTLSPNNRQERIFFPIESLLNENNKKRPPTHQNKKRPESQSRKKKIKENSEINVAQIETSVGSSCISKGKKVEQMVVQALTSEPKKKSALIFTYLSVLFLILMIILLLVQNLNLHTGINNVESQLPTIGIGLLAQYDMIYSASMLRQWKGTLDGIFSRDGIDDNLEFNSYLVYYTYYMSYYNEEFYELLAQLPEEMQSEFHKKNVGIYEYAEDGTKTLINMYSSYEAIQLMVEKELTILNMVIPDHYTPDIDKSNFNYVLDSAMNDLLIRSEAQIEKLTIDLNSATSSTTLKIGVTLAVVLAVCLIFAVVSVRYLWMMASEARLFMTMIFRIKPYESQTIRVILQQFISALEQDLKMQQQQEKIKIKEEDRKNNVTPVRFKSASMNSLHWTQILAFLKLLPIFSLFICWSLVYFFLTSQFIADIKDTQKRSDASLQGLNLESLYVYETFSVPLTNSAALVRNEEIMPSYIKTLNELAQVDAFVNVFRDRHGKLTDLQEKVLFNYPCDDLLPLMAESEYNYEAFVYAYNSCVIIANGKKAVGLVNILSELYSNGMHMLNQYENSNKTTEELGNIFLSMLDLNYDLLNAAEGFLGYLYGDVKYTFEDQFKWIKRMRWDLVACIIVVTLIVVWMTWVLVMKRIFKIQKIDWFVVQLVPIRVILGNKHIQQYLLKHSDGRFDNIRSYL